MALAKRVQRSRARGGSRAGGPHRRCHPADLPKRSRDHPSQVRERREPERKRPMGYFFVLRELIAKSVAERDDRERHDRDGENRVRREKSEIDGANPALGRRSG